MTPPRDIYVPMPKSVPVVAPSPAPAAAPLAPAPASTTPPASVLNPPAPISPRVGRDTKKRGKRGDAGEDAWRDPCNARRIAGIRPSLWHTVDDRTCGPGVNTGDWRIDHNIVRQHGAPKDSTGLPTAHTPDLCTPSSISDVEESPHVDWRHPMHREL